MDDNIDCYGRYQAKKTECADCEYLLSCRYYTGTVRQMARRRRDVSFEQISEFFPDTSAELPPAEMRSSRRRNIRELAAFFRYLLGLDDHTIGMIREVVLASAAGETMTVAKLSKLRSCSRQALHRKLLRTVSVHRELAALFLGILPKLSSSRKIFMCRALHDPA